MSESKGDYYADDFMEREPELKPAPHKFEKGDKVMVKRSYRSKGVATHRGGWQTDELSGTVIRVTKNNVFVLLEVDMMMGDPDPHPYPIDRVEVIPPLESV